MNIEKLTPAPWRSERRFSNGCETVPRIHCDRSKDRECGWVADLVGAPYLGYESTLANAEFIALARNAFDVMMRRGWWPIRNTDGKGWRIAWDARDCTNGLVKAWPWWDYEKQMDTPATWPDPFTALTDADKWYRKNVEKSNPTV